MSGKERNSLVRKILSKEFGKENIGVTSEKIEKGTELTIYSWCYVKITIDDPCSHEIDKNYGHIRQCYECFSCDGICKTNGIMLGKEQQIARTAVTARQAVKNEMQQRVLSLLDGVPFGQLVGSNDKDITIVLLHRKRKIPASCR
ncbi:MAG: hypothetical protein QME49_08115 [bacterium]|nr:hypothetical protein [bacterium]